MTKPDLVILFSGQGKLRPEILGPPPELLEVLDEIGRTGRQLALGAEEETALLVYSASVAAFRRVTRAGWPFRALLGQSFGEIPALVCGGAFTVQEGAEIVAARERALRSLPPGAGCMATVRAPARTVRAMIADLGASDIAIAVENSPTETVISGGHGSVQRMLNAAVSRGISVARLSSKHPVHCPPLMEEVACSLSRELQGLKAQPLQVPVYSAVSNGFLDSEMNLTEYIARSVARPVRFADALHRLRQGGATRIVNCSPLEGASRYVSRVFDRCWHAFEGGFFQPITQLEPRRFLAKSA